MKIHIDTAQLKKALGIARCGITNSSLPCLKFFFIEAKDEGKVSIHSTDLDTWVRADALATWDEPGAFTVTAAELTSLVGRFSGPLTTFIVDEDKVTVQNSTSKTVLPSLPAEDYPAPPQIESAHSFSLPAEGLVSALDEVVYAASKAETRGLLMGVLLNVQKNLLTAVATNTHRLACMEHPVSLEGEPLKWVVPADGIAAAINAFKGAQGDIEISGDNSRVAFSSNEVMIYSRLLDGIYPNYKRVVPEDNPYIAALPREDVFRALGRLMIIKPGANKIQMMFTASSLRMSATGEASSSEEEFPINYDGPNLNIAFDGKYLGDVFGKWDCETVKMRLKASLNPALFLPAGSESQKAVIMPMQFD